MRHFLYLIFLLPRLAYAQGVTQEALNIYMANQKAAVVVEKYDSGDKWVGRGSGFIVRNDAVVTNYHVMYGATRLRVKLTTGEILPVEGAFFADKTSDLALLKISGTNLPVVTMGDAYTLREGDKIFVISNPEDSKNMLSHGVVKGMIEFARDRKIIQITAPVIPGSSGGPVFNEKGEAVGVITGGILRQNVYFAIPISRVRRVMGNYTAYPFSHFYEINPGESVRSYRVQGIDDVLTVEERISFWRKFAEINREVAEGYSGLGSALSESGNHEDAVYNLNKAIQLDPSYPLAYEHRGLAHFAHGSYDAAIQDYNKAKALLPERAFAYFGLGSSYAEKGDWVRAIVEFTHAIERDPSWVEAYYSRGDLFRREGNSRAALDDFNKAIELEPQYAATYNLRAQIFKKNKEFDKAIADLQKAIQLNSSFYWAYNNLALVYMDKNDMENAFLLFNKAIELNPKEISALVSRGVAYERKGDLERAIEDYKRVAELDPDYQNPRYPYVHYSRGVARLEKKDYHGAIEDFTRVIQKDPKNTDAYLRRGLARFEREEYQMAISDFSKAIHLKPDFAFAYYNRGKSHLKAKEFKEAYADLQKSIELEPEKKGSVEPLIREAQKNLGQ